MGLHQPLDIAALKAEAIRRSTMKGSEDLGFIILSLCNAIEDQEGRLVALEQPPLQPLQQPPPPP